MLQTGFQEAGSMTVFIQVVDFKLLRAGSFIQIVDFKLLGNLLKSKGHHVPLLFFMHVAQALP